MPTASSPGHEDSDTASGLLLYSEQNDYEHYEHAEDMARFRDVPPSPETASESNMPEGFEADSSPEGGGEDSSSSVAGIKANHRAARREGGRAGGGDEVPAEGGSWDQADSPRAARRL